MKCLPMLLLAATASSPAIAAIDLLPKLIEVQSQRATRVTVVNRSDHPEFVTLSLSRLLNPGVPWQQERLESVGLVTSPTLYAYPLRLSLAVGQSKTIILQPLSAVPKEQVWRLVVAPVTALTSSAQASRSGGVAVNLSFSALVRQLPETRVRRLHSACSAGKVTLTATGTLRYPVKGLTVDGVTLGNFNVYPGTPVTLSGQRAVIDGKNICL